MFIQTNATQGQTIRLLSSTTTTRDTYILARRLTMEQISPSTSDCIYDDLHNGSAHHMASQNAASSSNKRRMLNNLLGDINISEANIRHPSEQILSI